MNRLPEPHLANELIESALEASCDALIALQLAETAFAGTARDQPARERNGAAIEAVRLAIDELRLSLGGSQSWSAMGFVLQPEQTTRALAANSPEVQSKPRRTA